MREILDEWVLLPVGERAQKYRSMLSLSECGAFLWQCLLEDTTEEKLLTGLASRYPEATGELIEEDLKAFIEQLVSLNLLDVDAC